METRLLLYAVVKFQNLIAMMNSISKSSKYYCNRLVMKLMNFVFNGTTSLKWSIFFIPVLHQRESYYSFINHEISLFLNILHMN